MHETYRIVRGRAEFVGFRTCAFARRTAGERRAMRQLWVAPVLVAMVMVAAAMPMVTRTDGPGQAIAVVGIAVASEARVMTTATGGLIWWLIERWRWDRVRGDRVARGWSSS